MLAVWVASGEEPAAVNTTTRKSRERQTCIFPLRMLEFLDLCTFPKRDRSQAFRVISGGRSTSLLTTQDTVPVPNIIGLDAQLRHISERFRHCFPRPRCLQTIHTPS